MIRGIEAAHEILANAKAVSVDLDDVCVGREKPTRMGAWAKGRTALAFMNLINSLGIMQGQPSVPHYLRPHTLDSLPRFDHTPVNKRWVDFLTFKAHLIRKAIPGVPEKLQALVDQGKKLFGNTGRAATVEWYEGTAAQLERERLPIPKENLLLTPLHERTAVSKADNIRELDLDVHVDDDLKTQIYLARLFRNTGKNFIWVQYGLTNIPVNKELMRALPNLEIVSIDDWKKPVASQPQPELGPEFRMV